MPLSRLALFVLAVALSSRASAGVLIEGRTQGDEPGKTQRFLLEGQKVRIDSNGGAQAVIFDGAAKKMIQLDAGNRAYTEFTKDDFARMKAMMTQAGAQAAAPKLPARRYEKTGKTDRALGQSCDVYRVLDDGAPAGEELCAAPFGAFGVSRADFDGFRVFGEFASDLSGGQAERSWADLPGIPLISWDVEGGKREESFRATKIEKRNVPASEFTVPAGWKKNPGFSEQMKQMEQLHKMQQGSQGK